MKTETAIGTFHQPKLLEGLPITFEVSTDATLQTTAARKWLNGLLHDRNPGLGEIDDVSSFEGKLIIEMSDAVLTAEEGLPIVLKYITVIKKAAPKLTDDELKSFKIDDDAVRAARADSPQLRTLDSSYENRF